MISAFIIAKNEEARIETALKSLVSFCDEIVVVDTGSTDRTKEIAALYTAKIFDFEWVDDFSAARNFALGKCTGEWVVFLDADDEIPAESQRRIKEVIGSAPQEVAGFFVNYHYGPEKFLLTPRVFRNRPELRFAMPIHEYLDVAEDLKQQFAVHPEITILHHKTAEQNQKTMERNIRILESSLKKDPGNRHLAFFLAREFFNGGEYGRAVVELEKLLANGISDRSFLYNVYLHLGVCLEKTGEIAEAMSSFEKAHESDGRFAEPLIYEANLLLYHLKKVEEAKKLYERALAIPLPKTTFPVRPEFYHQFPRKQLEKISRLHKPVALVCGYYGIPNVGDEFMLASIIKNLPDYRVVVASYNTQTTQKIHNIESVPHKHQLFDLALQQAKIVIIGGGTLFHDQGLAENKTVEYYCGLIERAARLKKRIVLLGIGVDQLQIEKNKELIKNIFPMCWKIFVREEASKKNLLDCGIPDEKISVMPDLVFGLPMEVHPGDHTGRSGHPENVKPVIGINLCPPIKNSAQNPMDVVDHELLPFLKLNREKYSFVYIPGKKDDLQLLEYLKRGLGWNIPCFQPDEKNYLWSYLQILDSCDVVIASRLHVMLLGVMLHKSVYALSYADKTDAILKEFPGRVKVFHREIAHEKGSITETDLQTLAQSVKDVFGNISR